MKLRDLINKLNENSDCEITISTLCDEYADGVELLKEEEWYIENRNCKVIDFNICFSGHCVPEIRINIER